MKVCIQKLDYHGRGIGHIDGKVVFVPRTLPKEEVEIHFQKQEKRYNIGEVDKIIQKSDERIPSFCPDAKNCGGCTYDIVSYQNSLHFKKKMIEDLFRQEKVSIPSFEIVESRPVLGYRNKVKFHVQNKKVGFYQEDSHVFVPISSCYLIHPKMMEFVHFFQPYLFETGILEVRINYQKELLISIETKNLIQVPEDFVNQFQIRGILINGKCVYGKPFFEDEINGFHYEVHANSFFQVNPFIASSIQQKILSYIKMNDTVLDLYCGSGFFTFPISKVAKSVTAIEVNPSSIVAAEKMKREQKCENISFHVGKVEQVLHKLQKKFDVVVIDPPRSGIHASVIETIYHLQAHTIIYVSCNPITLVRDLKKMNSYKIVDFICYDMFSYTKHVECLCVLQK